MAERFKASFYVNRSLWERFGKIADTRGHTRTWYLVGCVRETVAGQRREVKRKSGLGSTSEKKS